ncbi:MAG TPA: acyltransferase family protein, partial [Ktedonobacteraceae bacterium]
STEIRLVTYVRRVERSQVVPSKSAQHRNDIDGLRAIAVLAVVLYHAGVPQLKGGFIGVDVFFVISGFLIGGHVYSDMKQGRFSILEFYRKRAKRILPALLVVLLFCSLVSTLLLSAHELRVYGEYVIATVLSGSNILALRAADYFAPDANQNPLLMTWSLGVEEQFYVAFPIGMILMRKLDRTRLLLSIFLVAIASFCICIYQTHSHPAGAFYLLPARAWELAAGVLLALYENDRQAQSPSRWLQQLMSIAGIASILTGLFSFDDHTAFPGYAALMPVAGAVLLIRSPSSWINRRLLSLAPVVFLGSISYSLYLWHWPLLSFVHIVSDRPITPLMGCSISAISFLCAVLSYYFVEQPNRASQMPARPLLMRYALVCGLCIVPGLIFYIFSGLPQRVPQLSKIELSTDLGQIQCMADTSPILSKACHDVADQHPAIALIGDSHANALYPALLDIAHKSGFKLYEMAKASCPPLLGMARRIDTIAHAQECISYNAQVFSILKDDPSVKVVIMTGYWPDRISTMQVIRTRHNCAIRIRCLKAMKI